MVESMTMPPLIREQSSNLLPSVRSADENCLYKVKCVLVGDGAIGKTSLIVSYTTNGYPAEYVPTAFDNYSVVVNVNKHPVRFQLCDTAGQDDFDSLRPLCYPHTDVFLLCFSVVCPTSFYNIAEKWLPELRCHCPKTPVLLVGTQCDLRTDVKVLIELANYSEHPVSEEDICSLANKIGAVGYIECSALTQKNLKEVFDSALLEGLKFQKSELVHFDEPKGKSKCLLKRHKVNLICSRVVCNERKRRGWRKFCCFL